MERLHIPGLIGLILLGMVLGPERLRILPRGPVVDLLGSIGVIYIMFLAGIEVDWETAKSRSKETAALGILSFLLTFLPAVAVGRLMDWGWPAAVLLGAVISSHTLLTCPMVQKMELQHRPAVAAVVGGTLITDTLALVLLVVVLQFGSAGNGRTLDAMRPAQARHTAQSASAGMRRSTDEARRAGSQPPRLEALPCGSLRPVRLPVARSSGHATIGNQPRPDDLLHNNERACLIRELRTKPCEQRLQVPAVVDVRITQNVERDQPDDNTRAQAVGVAPLDPRSLTVGGKEQPHHLRVLAVDVQFLVALPVVCHQQVDGLSSRVVDESEDEHRNDACVDVVVAETQVVTPSDKINETNLNPRPFGLTLIGLQAHFDIVDTGPEERAPQGPTAIH